MTAFELANYVESGVWTAVAITCGVLSTRSRRGAVYTALLPATLVAFGISDIVEAFTGAWWRPWWLLVWKGGCLAILLTIGVRYYIHARCQPENGSS